MKIAIMQPYLFPYIGYFQLINAVDKFVVYDNIQYTKKGWINRNRILVNGKDEYISVPLKKDSDYLDIKDRFLADTWLNDKKKILNRISESYRKAPMFKQVFPILETCLNFNNNNLFEFIFNSLKEINRYINIKTPFVISSSLDIDHNLKSEDKVITICKAQEATLYLNPIGGVDLYSKKIFEEQLIQLNFIRTTDIVYKQYDNEFIPFLSIIDVMMFNNIEQIQNYINNNYLIQ